MAIQRMISIWKNVCIDYLPPFMFSIKWVSIVSELSPHEGEISTMAGRIKARSKRDEMDDDVLHKVCRAVGNAPGKKRQWKAMLCI